MAHTENFSAEIRSKRAVDSHADRTVESFEKGMGSSAERVEDTMKRLEERGYRKMDMTVLDVGGGTGTFTLPFAREYRQVDTLDISVPMQQRIREKAAKEQLENIRYLCKNWHTLDVEREGMKKQYDLVLSSINCRGIYNAETLHKMNQCSRGGCCLLTWAGQSRSSHGKNLQEIILGRTLETAGGNDIIFPFQMIYHMGGETGSELFQGGLEPGHGTGGSSERNLFQLLAVCRLRREKRKKSEAMCMNIWKKAAL